MGGQARKRYAYDQAMGHFMTDLDYSIIPFEGVEYMYHYIKDGHAGYGNVTLIHDSWNKVIHITAPTEEIIGHIIQDFKVEISIWKNYHS